MTNYTNYVSTWKLEKMAKSKVNFARVLTKLINERGYAPKLVFKAKDLDFSGSLCASLVEYGFLKVDRVEECWYKINDDTMKRGSVNVYVFSMTSNEVNTVMESLRRYKVETVEERISTLKEQLAKAYDDLNNI